MKKLIEYFDGFRWSDGNKESSEFSKTQIATRTIDGKEESYCIYDDCIAQGYELIELPQVEKDAHQLELLQNKAVSVMAATVIAECKSGTGKLYFSNIESAAMYTSSIQKDSEIRDRAIQLVEWGFAIDAYALSVVFDIDEGGEVPTLESFIAGLPKL